MDSLQPAISSQLKTILLVDDNPDDVDLALRALRRGNLTSDVVVKRDGLDAIEYLFGAGAEQEAAQVPQVILLDLKLPKVSGLDVLKRLRSDERTRLLPVVVLTSSKEEQDVLQSYSLGANSYVRKPVDFNQFVEAMRQLEQYWLALNEPPPLRVGRAEQEIQPAT
jgi:two-component system, response regulator